MDRWDAMDSFEDNFNLGLFTYIAGAEVSLPHPQSFLPRLPLLSSPVPSADLFQGLFDTGSVWIFTTLSTSARQWAQGRVCRGLASLCNSTNAKLHPWRTPTGSIHFHMSPGSRDLVFPITTTVYRACFIQCTKQSQMLSFPRSRSRHTVTSHSLLKTA